MKEKLAGILVIAIVFLSMCAEPPEEKKLTVSKFVFCTGVLQNGEYTPRSNSEFSAGENIHIYFELEGVETKDNSVSLKWDYLKIYKSGTLTDEKYNVLSYDQSFDTDISYVWMSKPIVVTEPGNYEVEIKVIDNYTGKQVTAKESFKVTGEIVTQTPPPTSAPEEKDIDVTYYYFLKVPSATYHLFGNIYENYVDVEITNNSSEKIRAKVEAQIMNFTDASYQTVDIPASQKITVSLTPPLMPNALDTLSEQKRTNFHIKVTYIESGEEKLVFEDTQSVTMLAKRDMVLWMQNFDFRDNIAAWVTPNDPSMDQFFSVAKKYMPGGTFAGYSEDEEGVLNQLEKIYYTLKKEYKISYLSTPNFRIYNNGEEVIQRIRFPSETLKGGTGNCIETAVLFASIFESLGMNAVIILRPRHAYVGVETQNGSGYYYFIETTMLGNEDVSFYDAWDYGSSEFDEDSPHLNNNEEAYRTIFIDDCRDAGISPIEG
jgi:hypothetical protein